ncbi:hypothetical protein BDV33DRAFT_178165 [Aspergillus novoparasiticus]|uniref:Uncharacterized protein n=1 Tax=Aspergillus novoparasiticus TaxID=986946 RepID=A0A5N6EIZ5_9EURO|nr:hypothetical protein BDV33DRAFT_178165 [Aspergillus novoparasiticus]
MSRSRDRAASLLFLALWGTCSAVSTLIEWTGDFTLVLLVLLWFSLTTVQASLLPRLGLPRLRRGF